MAHTARDAWDHHVVGPMIAWMIVGTLGWVIVRISALLLDWQILMWVSRFLVGSVFGAAGIASGTVLFEWAVGGDRWQLDPIDILLATLSLVAIAALASVIYGWWAAWFA